MAARVAEEAKAALAEEGLEALRGVAHEVVVVVDARAEVGEQGGLTMSIAFGLLDGQITAAAGTVLRA